jgi:hypothetical protein
MRNQSEKSTVVMEDGLGMYGDDVAMYDRNNLDAWMLSDYTVPVGDTDG